MIRSISLAGRCFLLALNAVPHISSGFNMFQYSLNSSSSQVNPVHLSFALTISLPRTKINFASLRSTMVFPKLSSNLILMMVSLNSLSSISMLLCH